MKNDYLNSLLIEYSKVNFEDYANLNTRLSDLATIDIKVDGAHLIASCIIKKTPNLKGCQLRNKGFLNHDVPNFKINKVEVLESRIVIEGDALEFSAFILNSAHEEKLYLKFNNDD